MDAVKFSDRLTKQKRQKYHVHVSNKKQGKGLKKLIQRIKQLRKLVKEISQNRYKTNVTRAHIAFSDENASCTVS